MAQIENWRAKQAPSTTELVLDQDIERAKKAKPIKAPHNLDSEEALKTKRKLIDWYYQEREKQAVNRYQMALDEDCYDGDQWDPEDALEVEDRGQAAIVYNETAPMVDWMIGTERRTRFDWKVLPRSPDDVQMADVKTKAMKYVADVNNAPMNRSRAFSDAVKVGVGWIEDTITDDPTREIIVNRYENWRYVLWDSAAMELDLSDARYLFRWRWVDLDLAEHMFPERKAQLHKAATNYTLADEEDEDFWYMGQHYQARDRNGQVIGRRTYVADAALVGNRRNRVKLIEAQYREPTVCKVCRGDPRFEGMLYDEKHEAMNRSVNDGWAYVADTLMMRVHWAVMTEKDLLALGQSPFRHNRFTLTPIWCYRRGRDRMPYGLVRRIRDIQDDLNKRASKAQFVLSTNQIIGEEGAVADWEEAREEADRPDGVIIVRPNKRFDIQRDSEMAKGHMELMQMDAMKIQRMAGVNDENLGRETNASSGEAIKARQLQGSVTTTEPFDNQRFAMQESGRKNLSLIEQFMSERRIIRLTEAKGPIQWLKVNVPEIQTDGSVRYLNDITASQADFVVSEQDYHGTLRQAMFDAMSALAGRAGVAPEMAIKFLRMAFEFSDFPNKDEIVAELRKMVGEPDPSREPTPEEAQQLQQAQALQQEAIERQRQMGALEVEKLAAEVRKINAEAEKAVAEIGAGDGGQAEAQIRQIQERAAEQIDKLTQELRVAQTELANKVAQIGQEADTATEVARIEADAQVRVAEIEKEAAAHLESLMKGIQDIRAEVGEVAKQVQQIERDNEAREKKAEQDKKAAADEQKARDKEERERRAEEKREKKEAGGEGAAPAMPPQATVVFEAGAIQIAAGSPAVEKTVTGEDGKGNKITMTIKPKKGTEGKKSGGTDAK